MPEFSSKVTSNLVVEDVAGNRFVIVEVTFCVSTQRPGGPVATKVLSRQLYLGDQKVALSDLDEGMVLVKPPGKKMRILSVDDIGMD